MFNKIGPMIQVFITEAMYRDLGEWFEGNEWRDGLMHKQAGWRNYKKESAERASDKAANKLMMEKINKRIEEEDEQ